MLQISRSGVVISGSEADIERARADFKKQDWVRLPAILDRELLGIAQAQLGESQFEEKTANLYRELTVADSAPICASVTAK